MADLRNPTRHRRELMGRWLELMDGVNQLQSDLERAPEEAFTDDEFAQAINAIEEIWSLFANARPQFVSEPAKRPLHPMIAKRVTARLRKEGYTNG